MSKIMQNLVVLMEPSEYENDVSLKTGNMIFNRFCIDEDAAFELSGVNYLKKSSKKMEDGESIKFKVKRKLKGKEVSKDYSFVRFETVLLQFEKLYLTLIDNSPKKNFLIRTLLILHYKKLMKTSPKNLKYTLFMLVIIIIRRNIKSNQ